MVGRSIRAKKLRDVVTNVEACLAIEIMTAAAGLDQRSPLRPSGGVYTALSTVRTRVAPMTGDRPLYIDIAAVRDLVASKELVTSVENAVGTLM